MARVTLLQARIDPYMRGSYTPAPSESLTAGQTAGGAIHLVNSRRRMAERTRRWLRGGTTIVPCAKQITK